MLGERELSEKELQEVEHGGYDAVILVEIHVLREVILRDQVAEVPTNELEHMREVLNREDSCRTHQHFHIKLYKMQHAVPEELLRKL